MKIKHVLCAVILFCVIAISGVASAQWNNSPYQVRSGDTGGTGVGMSDAYRQAVLDQERFGQPSGQVYRAPSGSLVILERGPGNLAAAVGPRDRLAGDPPVMTHRRQGDIRGFGFGGRDGAVLPSLPLEPSASTTLSLRISVVDAWTAQLAAMAD
jgi:hypothetical protein